MENWFSKRHSEDSEALHETRPQRIYLQVVLWDIWKLNLWPETKQIEPEGRLDGV